MGPAANVLDVQATVASESRTAGKHGEALCRAVSAASGITTNFNGPWFDNHFAANGYVAPRVAVPDRRRMVFEWGADRMTARDALIRLLGRSAATMTWRLMCEPSAQPADRFCSLNVLALTR